MHIIAECVENEATRARGTYRPSPKRGNLLSR